MAADPPAMQAILDNSLTTWLAPLKEKAESLATEVGHFSRPPNAVNEREANLAGHKTTSL